MWESIDRHPPTRGQLKKLEASIQNNLPATPMSLGLDEFPPELLDLLEKMGFDPRIIEVDEKRPPLAPFCQRLREWRRIKNEILVARVATGLLMPIDL